MTTVTNSYIELRKYMDECQRHIKRVYVHTADHEGETSVERIRKVHLRRGFTDIGYHFVVRQDGEIQYGRPINDKGAGVKTDNRYTIHVCFAGDGDIERWTDAQVREGIELLITLCEEFELDADQVWGHKEFWTRRKQRHKKSCPGKMVPMGRVRDMIEEGLDMTMCGEFGETRVNGGEVLA